MNSCELLELIEQGETETIEFKSWVKTPDFKKLIKLCVKEIVALSNSNGGYLLVGVEDDQSITGCMGYDLQNIIESIYDRTMPNIFTKA
ncbi:MAG: ATP-binding protein, partial [Erysipelotrichales bacterium]|nr:ATP-binding protein [Erysipelotrichales bacterium]